MMPLLCFTIQNAFQSLTFGYVFVISVMKAGSKDTFFIYFFAYDLKLLELVLYMFTWENSKLWNRFGKAYTWLFFVAVFLNWPPERKNLDSGSCFRNTHIKAQSSIRCQIIIIPITWTDYSLQSRLKRFQQSEYRNTYWRKNTDRKVFMR